MQSKTLASVVIPTYNRPDLLQICLDALRVSLAASEGNVVEIIVTDDSANIDSKNLVSQMYPWVRYLPGPRRGPASNRNNGAAVAQGDWLIFLDDDCIPSEAWINAYLNAFKHQPNFEVFEGRTTADRVRKGQDEESPVNETGGYLWSCNMAIASRFYSELGGFCETFPYAAMEDVDFRLRIQKAGKSFKFIKEAVVCHPYRPTKGIAFAKRQNQSYLHLLERHPDLVSNISWKVVFLNGLRLIVAVIKNTIRLGVRGSHEAIYRAITKTLIDIRFKLKNST